MTSVRFFEANSVQEHMVVMHGVDSCAVARDLREAERQHQVKHQAEEGRPIHNLEAWITYVGHVVKGDAA